MTAPLELDGRKFTGAELRALPLPELAQLAKEYPDAPLMEILLSDETEQPLSPPSGRRSQLGKSARNREKRSQDKPLVPQTHNLETILADEGIHLAEGQIAVFKSLQPEQQVYEKNGRLEIADSQPANHVMLIQKQGQDLLLALYEPSLNHALSHYPQVQHFDAQFSHRFDVTATPPPHSEEKILLQVRISPQPGGGMYTPWKYRAENWIGDTSQQSHEHNTRYMKQAAHYLGTENLGMISPIGNLIREGTSQLHR